MTFHPDKNLPDCMMPDGGECCAGHAAVCEDWHKQRAAAVEANRALAAVRKVRDGYASQAKFADHESAAYFREFVRRLDAAVLATTPSGGPNG